MISSLILMNLQRKLNRLLGLTSTCVIIQENDHEKIFHILCNYYIISFSSF